MRESPNPKKREVVLIFGKTGMGKSFFANEFLYRYNRVIILDPMLEYDGVYCATVEEIHEEVKRRPALFRIVTDCLAEFERLCAYVYSLEDCCFAIEEAQRVIPAGNYQMGEAFSDLIFRGRHKRVSLAIISQRASTVSIQARSQWSEMYLFRQTEPQDIRYLYQQTGNEEINELGKLEAYNYFHVTPKGVELKKPIPAS